MSHCILQCHTVSHCVTLCQTVPHCISHKIYIEVGCLPKHTTFTLLHCPTLNINIELVCIFPFLTLQIYLKITNCRIRLNILSVTCACVQCACLHKRLHTLDGSALFHNGWFSSGCLFSMAWAWAEGEILILLCLLLVDTFHFDGGERFPCFTKVLTISILKVLLSLLYYIFFWFPCVTSSWRT